MPPRRAFWCLAGLFIASLVTCNLVFRKFFQWDFGGMTFEQSVGLLPYPLTFLVTDLISEIYGKSQGQPRRACPDLLRPS